MREKILFTDEDLMEDQEDPIEQPQTPEEALWQVQEELELVRQERDKFKADSTAANRQVTQWKMVARKERELRVAAQRRKPVVLPLLGIAACALLAVLVFVATDHQLVVEKLGNPVAFTFIGFGAFFGGLIWDRRDPLRKLKGGMPDGNE